MSDFRHGQEKETPQGEGHNSISLLPSRCRFARPWGRWWLQEQGREERSTQGSGCRHPGNGEQPGWV